MGSTVYPAAGGGLTQKFAEYKSTGTFTPPTDEYLISIGIMNPPDEVTE